MPSLESRPLVSPGEPAPDFVLPAVDHDGTVSLADFRGKTPVLLAMMRALYCAFCRRRIAQLGVTRQRLLQLGVEVLAIVGMRPERLQLYYRYRPVGVPLAADPDLITHRAYGVPQPPLTPEILQAVASKHVELARELRIPATDQAEIKSILAQRDGFEPIASELVDRRDWSDRYGGQLTGQFLVDREGIVRWVNIEGAKDGLSGLERFPTDEEFLLAARELGATRGA
ncbi:MAG TPA: redoxin domain-containing protein [Burkholderiales bacterium]|jgi:peroxiredoxin|nr:redoxin domain-containing protein [Burkholderiales bacterium]